MTPFDQSLVFKAAQQAAQAAPSILNTQPWSVRPVPENRIELRANPDKDPEGRERHLKSSDPRKRELIISCGAALYNLRLAIWVAGHEAAVHLFPDPSDRDLLAMIEVDIHHFRHATYREQCLYEVIFRRHTTREPFGKAPLEMNMVAELEQAGQTEMVHARLLHSRQVRQLIRDTARVNESLRIDPAYLHELKRWTGCHIAQGRGVPPEAFGPLPRDEDRTPIRDLGLAWGPRPRAQFEKKVRLVLLTTQRDELLDWIYAGQALQKLLLTATRYHVAASFLTQLFEYYDKNHAHTYDLFPWPGYCHAVIRLGFPSKRLYVTPHESI